jgi:hypothetical protein
MSEPDQVISSLRDVQRQAREHLAEGERAECGGSCREDCEKLIAQIDDDIRRITQ